MPDSFHLADAADDDEAFNPFDNISHPAVRFLFNHITTQISPHFQPVISRLTDSEITRRIKSEAIHLPDAEIITMADRLSRFFPAPNSKAEKKKITRTPPLARDIIHDHFKSDIRELVELARDAIHDHFKSDIRELVEVFVGLYRMGLCLTAYVFISAFNVIIQSTLSRRRLAALNATLNAAQERLLLKPLKRSSFLSKYSTTPLKGLKEIYFQEFYTDFRQEVEQHQESSSRTVVPSSRSSGICPSYF